MPQAGGEACGAGETRRDYRGGDGGGDIIYDCPDTFDNRLCRVIHGDMDSPPPLGRAFLPGEVGTDNTQCPGMGAECVGSCDSRSNRTVGERLMAELERVKAY